MPATGVLNGEIRRRVGDGDHRARTKRTLSPARKIAGGSRAGSNITLSVCPMNAPSARRDEWVDTRLRAGDGDTSGRNPRSWPGPTREMESGIQLTEISPSGDEADQVNAVRPREVPANDVFGRESKVGRDVLEIRTIVCDGNLMSTRRVGR